MGQNYRCGNQRTDETQLCLQSKALIDSIPIFINLTYPQIGMYEH